MRTRTLAVVGLALAIALFALLPAQRDNAAASPSLYPPTMHCVQYGETLFALGRMYGVSPYAIAYANGLVNPNYIRAGQCLRIPGHPGWMPAPPVPQPHTYMVRFGDTLWSIGVRFGVSPWAIASANGIANPNYIRAGQYLTIP